MRQFTCRLDSGDTWRVTVLAGGQAALGAGDAVRLTIAADDVAVIGE